MERNVANCPAWLKKRIKDEGGIITFSQYMDWVLNDTKYGAYSSGRIKIGKTGDFATSPSLGFDFAELLSVQLVDWFEQLENKNIKGYPLSLIDIGPGEGHLSKDLIRALEKRAPEILKKMQFILVEPNLGMAYRQKKKLEEISSVPISWKTLNELKESPVVGIVIAHELLDALPVERLVVRNKKLFLQGVSLSENEIDSGLEFVDLPLSLEIQFSLDEIEDSIGLKIPPVGVEDGWCSEWHYELSKWFEISSKILIEGSMLVVDYAFEAYRYYNARRSSGTLMAYKNNVASSDLLKQPGSWDLTSHLCIETLCYFANKNGWNFLGQVKQGQALLSLGLAERLHSLQYISNSDLNIAFERRDNLLSLVDPSGLGGFRWIAFQINKEVQSNDSTKNLKTLFLEEPNY